MDAHAHRVTPHAIMIHSRHQDVVEPGVLYDARIVKMSGDDLVISGFERADFELREYRQAWLMRPITRKEMETPIPADVVRGAANPDAANKKRHPCRWPFSAARLLLCSAPRFEVARLAMLPCFFDGHGYFANRVLEQLLHVDFGRRDSLAGN